MNLIPNGYFNKVSDINYEYLEKNNIKGLLLDVDNTLIDYYKNISQDTIEWAKKLQGKNIKMCILSNSHNETKIKDVAKKLNIEHYIFLAMKPSEVGFKKAQKILQLENNEIAVVGDQIFTDIVGANKIKMYSILVEPIDKKDIWLTLIKRPLENLIKKKYLKTKEN